MTAVALYGAKSRLRFVGVAIAWVATAQLLAPGFAQESPRWVDNQDGTWSISGRYQKYSFYDRTPDQTDLDSLVSGQKQWRQNPDGTWSIIGDGHRYRFSSPPISTDPQWWMRVAKRDVGAEIQARDAQFAKQKQAREARWNMQQQQAQQALTAPYGQQQLQMRPRTYDPAQTGGSQPYQQTYTPARTYGNQGREYNPSSQPYTPQQTYTPQKTYPTQKPYTPTQPAYVQPPQQTYTPPPTYKQPAAPPPTRDVTARRQAPATAARRQGKDYAIFFATNNYSDTHFNGLKNPVLDARAIGDDLKSYYGWDVKVVENPSLKTVLSVLKEYGNRAYGKDDQLMIFFAGHGTFDDAQRMGYIVASDSKSDDDVKMSYLSSAQLLGLVDRMNCEHIMVCLDVCFGGTFDDYVAQNFASASRGDDDYPELSPDELFARKAGFRTRKLLAASGKEPVSDGAPGRHSPFAARLLDILRGYGGKDGYISFGAITRAVERVKPGPHAVEFASNQPGSDFFFIARRDGTTGQGK